MLHKSVPLGIYEKALPPGEDWLTRLQLAGELGFDFVEMSIDESDGRLARWTGALNSGSPWLAPLRRAVCASLLYASAPTGVFRWAVQTTPRATGDWRSCEKLFGWRRIPVSG